MRPHPLILTLLAVFATGQLTLPAQGEDTLIRATVRRVLAPHMFTLDYQPGENSELIVLAPNAEATPVPGATILVGGLLRMVGEAELKATPGWNEIELSTRDSMAGRPMLVAISVRTAEGRQLMPSAAASRAARQAQQGTPAGGRGTFQARVHPGAFAELIDELGGHQVELPRARVLVVINPQAFLVESASTLAAVVSNLDRVLVLVEKGVLRVEPALLVGSNVIVRGRARTLLGMQVTNEVPWPEILTREVTDRFEIRAAVLATSVQTSDGVELTTQK
jgi:hypothetical protein